MSENKKDTSLISKFVPWIILYTFLLIALLVAKFSTFHFSNEIGDWGAVGDYFGGLLNPLFAFLSFMGVLWTLKMSREELEETRKVMDEQLKTQKLQQFENNFYQLFSQLNKLQNDILKEYQSEIDRILNAEQQTLSNIKKYLIRFPEISRYFIFLYQMMKLIDREIPKVPSEYKVNTEQWLNETKQNKKFYTNLIRSQQDNQMLQLLFINCFDNKFLNFKKYLKEASFFEHMSFFDKKYEGYNYFILQALPFYIEKQKDLKGENISYFDKSFTLVDLVEYQSFVLNCIYKNKSIEEYKTTFVHNIIKKIFRKKVFYDELTKSTLTEFNFDEYLIRFTISENNIDEDMNFKVQQINILSNSINFLTEMNETVALFIDLDSSEIIIKPSREKHSESLLKHSYYHYYEKNNN